MGLVLCFRAMWQEGWSAYDADVYIPGVEFFTPVKVIFDAGELVTSGSTRSTSCVLKRLVNWRTDEAE